MPGTLQRFASQQRIVLCSRHDALAGYRGALRMRCRAGLLGIITESLALA